MNEKIDKWLCENFKNDDDDVTIGNILKICGVSLFVVIVVLYFICVVVFMVGWSVHGVCVRGDGLFFNRDIALIDGLIGVLTLLSMVIIVYASNEILSYKVTTCKRKGGD